MKGVEIGDGFETARTPGSAAHDAIHLGRHGATSYRRPSSRAGGHRGRHDHRRPARRPGRDEAARHAEPAGAAHRRRRDQGSDACRSGAHRRDRGARAGVVAETMVALVLAGEALRKFGGDSLASWSATTTRSWPRCGEPGHAPSSRPRRPDGCRQDDGGGAVRGGASTGPSSTLTTWCRTSPGAASPTCSPKAKRRSGPSSATRSPTRARPPTPLVIACGGGAVLDPTSRRRLRDTGFVVWLHADPHVLADRVHADGVDRPLLTDRGASRRSPASPTPTNPPTTRPPT